MKNTLRTIVVGIFIVMLIAMGAVSCLSYAERREVTATIDSKERVCDTHPGKTMQCRYLIFTDQGTYQITDSLLAGRWSSSDTYARFKEGETYKFEVYGWRIPISSSYPNVASEPSRVG